MHLISHASSAFCLGACLLPFNQRFPRSMPLVVPTLVAFGSLLPDLDGITVLFAHGIYYGNRWFSHRGLLHTPLGILPFVTLTAYAASAIIRGLSPGGPRSNGAIFGALYLGSFLHMVEDMMTPPGPWGGLMMLWPFSAIRCGGFSRISWMNEYLIAVQSACALLTLAVLLIIKRTAIPWRAPLAVFMILTSLGGLAETARFVGVSRFENSGQWEAYQKDLLGDRLYGKIHWLVLTTQEIWIREIL